MRASIGERGAAGSTFDVVAREAGVSRGLLHYYFGSKERLLVEVVRQRLRRCASRALDAALAQAASVDEILAALVTSLESFVADEPDAQAVLYEMVSASRHSEEIRAELAELYRRWRAHLAAALREKQQRGRRAARRRPRVGGLAPVRARRRHGLQLMADPDWNGGRGLRARRRDRAAACSAPEPSASRSVTKVTAAA